MPQILSHTLLQNMLDYLPCGISIFNTELNLVAHNQKFRTLLDLPDRLFEGPVVRFEDIMRNNAARGEYGPGDVEDIVAKLVARAHHPQDMLFERIRHDGKPLEVRSGPMPDGGFVTTYMDITERKNIERLKSEFISTISHELRTPLTSIYGSLSMLDTGVAGELSSDVGELIKLSLGSTERLMRLINEVLDMEKIESKMMTYHKVDQPLAPIIRQAVATTRHYANQFDVELVWEQMPEDSIVNVDTDRIIQVVVNLLSNAAKFSKKGGVVVIELSLTSDKVKTSISDQGSGIPFEFRSRIFSRFSQADGSDHRKRTGTGLGLNICKSIVEEHGGTIDYHSEVGIGTTFFFYLPLVR